jgi:large subunit ribosomal protein L16
LDYFFHFFFVLVFKMLLFPKKTKYKKHQKGKSCLKRVEMRYIFPKRGFFGLKIADTIRVRSNQIEAARKVIRKRIKRRYCLAPYSNIFADRVATRKSSGVRMGKGKGNPAFWYSVACRGLILFELSILLPKAIARKALQAASYKFPAKCKIITKFGNVV